ncbi:fumarylacetoacetate hydrolase family protein [Bacillus tianshenii]|uniref:fumarylacetoacetate hydrolase family protein n=1 Tax=Sutcliffiella tianshenii TaxID=1463404 RepID=UPI001CD5D10F|nr:fumarylacetoacetate hydrolase family protein [Bacillus tianshenii]MCA1320139.1 fumarylacetoacetate hydrolase family protein [Bacillus tianshenii]
MHFLTAQYNGKIFVGLTDESQQYVIDLHQTEKVKDGLQTLPHTLMECIALGDYFMDKAAALRDWVLTHREAPSFFYKMEEVTLLAPIPRPAKNVLCVGKNYKDHVLEMGSEGDIPEHIMIFTKAPTSVIGDGDDILLHEGLTSQLDYEGELAVVIGKEGVGIKEEEAYDHVFGYTIINDITARDMQARHKQFFLGKSLDASCPMGPVIVHKSAIEDPHNLEISTLVNGEVRQHARTDLMIFSIPEMIATLSKGMTLEPGDIIATGTPAGVGKGFNPPRFLKRGDVLEVIVEGIGKLTNKVN